MSAFTPEQLAEMKAAVRSEMDAVVQVALTKYTKADSALHVFIRDHSQAAFNYALFGGLIVGGLVGKFIL